MDHSDLPNEFNNIKNILSENSLNKIFGQNYSIGYAIHRYGEVNGMTQVHKPNI